MNLLVVGAGEMGMWFGSHFEHVAYADRDDQAAERAADETSGRTVGLDTDETFEVVCVAVPIPAVEHAVAAHADRATRAIVDVTGVMEPAITAMREHGPDLERLSLHPLFSARHAPGRVAAVVDAAGPTADLVRDRLTEAGNAVFETTSDEHDRAMRTVQAAAHAAIISFALAGEAVDERFHTDISAELFELVDRVTDGTPRVYADIQDAFGGAAALADAAATLSEADAAAFERLYADARRRLVETDPDVSPDAGSRTDTDQDARRETDTGPVEDR